MMTNFAVLRSGAPFSLLCTLTLEEIPRQQLIPPPHAQLTTSLQRAAMYFHGFGGATIVKRREEMLQDVTENNGRL